MRKKTTKNLHSKLKSMKEETLTKDHFLHGNAFNTLAEIFHSLSVCAYTSRWWMKTFVDFAVFDCKYTLQLIWYTIISCVLNVTEDFVFYLFSSRFCLFSFSFWLSTILLVLCFRFSDFSNNLKWFFLLFFFSSFLRWIFSNSNKMFNINLFRQINRPKKKWWKIQSEFCVGFIYIFVGLFLYQIAWQHTTHEWRTTKTHFVFGVFYETSFAAFRNRT